MNTVEEDVETWINGNITDIKNKLKKARPAYVGAFIEEATRQGKTIDEITRLLKTVE